MHRFLPLPLSRVRLIRDLLANKKARKQEGTFVIEGAKPIQELLHAKAPALRTVVVTETWLKKVNRRFRETLEQGRAEVYVCRDPLFERFSEVHTPSGILALVQQPDWDQAALFRQSHLLGLYGDCLQDPANVGTIIRTAAGFGIDALWLSPDSVDVFNPKVVRATAGSILTLPVFYNQDAGLFDREGCSLLAAEPPGRRTTPLQAIKSLPARAIVALGNESQGLSETTLQQACVRFHIPLRRSVESLNVAASAAIAIFYLSGLPREDIKREA
jgi:TrmH family RNA methyltransferase